MPNGVSNRARSSGAFGRALASAEGARDGDRGVADVWGRVAEACEHAARRVCSHAQLFVYSLPSTIT